MHIRELRKKRNLSQAELAEKLDVHENTVRRWETGKFEPRVNDIQNLCKVLKCTEDELLYGAKDGKIRITLSYDWSKYEKGEIDMTGNAFDLNLGKIGTIGLHGAGDFTSLQDIDEFLARAREQLVAAFEAQVKRGAIQPQPAI